MNSLCLQEQAAGFSEVNYSDGEQSAPLNWNHTQLAYCAPDKMTAFSRLSQFGMMYKPLTENRGEALLMSYLGAFHAKTSAQPEKAQELTGSAAVCGSTWHASFAKYDHDTSFVENSPMLTSRGLGTVLGDLASMGFDARWGVLGAADIGANHQRDRIWIVAKWRGQLPHAQHEKIRRWEQQQEGVKKSHVPNTSNNRCGKWANEYKHWEQNATPNAGTYGEEKSLADTDSAQRQRNKCAFGSHTKHTNIGSSGWWETEPNVGRVADGVASRVDRLKAIGNGQVPLCAAAAWKILSENL
jgi:hypothetical protein